MDEDRLSPDTEVFLERVRAVVDGVFGELAPQMRELCARVDLIGYARNPEAAEPILRRAYEQFVAGYERFRQSPQDFEHIRTWQHECNRHGLGSPTIPEAIREEFGFGLLDDYASCLEHLALTQREAGKVNEAERTERCREAVLNFPWLMD